VYAGAKEFIPAFDYASMHRYEHVSTQSPAMELSFRSMVDSDKIIVGERIQGRPPAYGCLNALLHRAQRRDFREAVHGACHSAAVFAA